MPSCVSNRRVGTNGRVGCAHHALYQGMAQGLARAPDAVKYG